VSTAGDGDQGALTHFEKALDKDLAKIEKTLDRFGSKVMKAIEKDVIRELSNYYIDSVTFEVDVSGLADLVSGLKGSITVAVKHVVKDGVTQPAKS
jgi:hypothetical protein